MYTYEMMQTIKLMSDGKISLTNLYIAIYRLEDFQFIRKDFEELYLRRLIDEYRAFTQAVEEILKTQFPLTPLE